MEKCNVLNKTVFKIGTIKKEKKEKENCCGYEDQNWKAVLEKGCSSGNILLQRYRAHIKRHMQLDIRLEHKE